MNYQFDFDHQIRLLKISFAGDLDDKQLLEVMDKIRELLPTLNPAFGITDFSQVTAVDIPSGTVSSLAHLRPTFPAEVPRVIVAPPDYLYGLARMFQSVGAEGRPKLQVVRSLAEGYRVLGISAIPTFERLEVA